MKKITTILSICLSITFLNGQDFSFPQDSASWKYLVRGADGGQVYTYGYMTFTLYGDTIINGEQYKLISSVADCFSSIQILSTVYDFIRTEGDKVYILYNDATEEVLLYDFGMEIGDTLTVDNCGYPYLDSFIVVQNIGETPLFNGETRKTFFFGDMYEPKYTWIEGIGNIGDGMLSHSPYVISHDLLDPTWYKLVSFSHNGELIITDTSHEPLTNHGMKIYPNPVSSILNLEAKQNDIAIRWVRIMNLLGEVIFQKQYDHATVVSIDSEDWAPGLYVVVVNERFVEKVVVK